MTPDANLSDLNPKSELARLTARLRIAERENARLLRQQGEFDYLVKQIKTAVVAFDPVPYVPLAADPGKRSTVYPVFKLSDWQIGELVKANATEGFGRFNYDIACRRMNTILESMLKYIDVQRRAYHMPEAHVFLEGDFISGDIHHELTVTNEFPVPVQAVKAGNLMSEVLRSIGSRFRQVHVWAVACDNHGRLTPKPQSKDGALNNMNQVVYALAEARTERDPKFIWHGDPESLKLIADVGGIRFLVEHGNHVLCVMGTPYYTLDRNLGREALKRMNGPRAKQFRYQSIGHWHVDAVLSGRIFVNGCLPGTGERDHQLGRGAEPSQTLLMVGKHGVFNRTVFTCV